MCDIAPFGVLKQFVPGFDRLLTPIGWTHAEAALEQVIEQAQAAVTAIEGNLRNFFVRIS